MRAADVEVQDHDEETAAFPDVPPLHLLKAERLPATRRAVAGTMNQRTADALRTVIGVTPQDSDRHALAAVDAALDCLAPPAAATGYTDAERKSLPEDLYEEHDLFFGAVRVAGDSVETFTYTMLEALRSQLDDALSAGISLSDGERAELRDAFWTTFHLLWRIGVAGTPFEYAARARPRGTCPRTGRAGGDPLVRWRLGHQVFFALIQALIVSVGCLEECLREDPDDIDGACRLLEDATVLMTGSGASLRYAGDFTRSHYADAVRPAMMPPHINAKFSGLQLRDHRILLKLIHRVKPLVASPAPAVDKSYGMLLDAMSTAYAAHISVCSRFGGDREPSLRTPGSRVPAVEILQRFRDRRLGAATPDRAPE
ncbi:hypothetical protein OH540_00725 [Streptomyces sp. BPPL-273]|uniref:Uncharacterized protein n=1 Tax=Streptomyces parvulus TaxID=146923 RepID=A0A191VAK9_9ACTN|nr:MULTISPECIES: hypothetical protein [Streptomyces]ANJ11913.1 hypothetical protein Spa2297_32935 [Streptomyces parvulus]MZD55067.1 hypothetical protein [Streptomyces sp. SID5606]WHM28610.1 hypothetical protein OH540_00725 [Streptomyces sp. BPPL-273]GGS07107.1 hypothetical protein GCM10010220_68920 [Streptomyces parvulus]